MIWRIRVSMHLHHIGKISFSEMLWQTIINTYQNHGTATPMAEWFLVVGSGILHGSLSAARLGLRWAG